MVWLCRGVAVADTMLLITCKAGQARQVERFEMSAATRFDYRVAGRSGAYFICASVESLSPLLSFQLMVMGSPAAPPLNLKLT